MPGLSCLRSIPVPSLLPKLLKSSLPEDALPDLPHLTLVWQLNEDEERDLVLVLGSNISSFTSHGGLGRSPDKPQFPHLYNRGSSLSFSGLL